MAKFICPHCSANQTKAALALLRPLGQAFWLAMSCGDCGKPIRWELTYAMVIDTVTAIETDKNKLHA